MKLKYLSVLLTTSTLALTSCSFNDAAMMVDAFNEGMGAPNYQPICQYESDFHSGTVADGDISWELAVECNSGKGKVYNSSKTTDYKCRITAEGEYVTSFTVDRQDSRSWSYQLMGRSGHKILCTAYQEYYEDKDWIDIKEVFNTDTLKKESSYYRYKNDWTTPVTCIAINEKTYSYELTTLEPNSKSDWIKNGKNPVNIDCAGPLNDEESREAYLEDLELAMSLTKRLENKEITQKEAEALAHAHGKERVIKKLKAKGASEEEIEGYLKALEERLKEK